MAGITACESKVTRKVEPSGGLLATWAAPSEPAAPDLFSTMMVRPSFVCRWACSSRASASVEPPGGNGTSSVIFDACAGAGATAKAADAASRVRLVIFCMVFSPDVAAPRLLFARLIDFQPDKDAPAAQAILTANTFPGCIFTVIHRSLGADRLQRPAI